METFPILIRLGARSRLSAMNSRKDFDAENCKPAVQGLRRLYDLVAVEPKVSMTALQTVGSDGHDGFAIAVVIADQ